MRILLSGSHGLIGGSLLLALRASSHQIFLLSREQLETLDPSSLEGFDALIHLSGENIAQGAWTPEKKRVIWESRCTTSRRLSEALSKLSSPPKVVLAASACGFYGNSEGPDPFTELSPQGHGFLADLCGEWEKAWETAVSTGIRVVYLRFSPVLSSKNGILKELLLPFKLCLGGKMGNGEQFVSWISIDDVVGAISHILDTPTIEGPINLTSPGAVRQKEFARLLGEALHRPAWFHIPAVLIRWLYGEKGQTLILGSSWVIPNKLLESGYKFKHQDLLSCLQELL